MKINYFYSNRYSINLSKNRLIELQNFSASQMLSLMNEETLDKPENLVKMLLSNSYAARNKHDFINTLPILETTDEDLKLFARYFLKHNRYLLGKKQIYIGKKIKTNFKNHPNFLEVSKEYQNIAWPKNDIEKLKYAWDLHIKNERTRMFSANLKVLKSLESQGDLLREYSKILETHDIIPFFDLHTSQIQQFLEEYDDAKNKELLIEEFKEAILDYFDNDFFLTLKDEVRESKTDINRKDIILEAIELHIEGRYKSSIPLLLIQTEGLIKEYYDFSKGDRLDRYLHLLLTKKYKQAKFKLFEMDFQIRKSITEVFSVKKLGKLSRNYILHGKSLDYGNRFNSLQCIFIIKYILNVVSNENE